MKYRVVVDSSLDSFGQKEVEPYKEYNTLKEARAMVRNFYRDRHFACHNQYYIQHFKNGKWVYLDKVLQAKENEKKKPIMLKKINLAGDEVELPFEVELTKAEANYDKLALFKVIKELVKAFPKETL